MLKKKTVKKAKKKIIDSFVDFVKPKAVPETPKKAVPACECGNPVMPGTNQCWGCAHRA